MNKSSGKGLFGTNKRIRMGLWGLGRGMSFFDMCRTLNMDIVAGCDFNEHMRARFKEANPDAMVTADAREFLDTDFDAVLLATYCPAHADDAIACLEAGKHVLSEVTSFHTMSEGVRLVEAVERSGKIYNLAENYPFSAPQVTLARYWHEGIMGDLMYAEGEYVHEVRTLCYTHIDGVPIEPGYALHNWRSWLNFHYYCTHSLGPIMVVTGTRPTRVVSLPGTRVLPGFPLPNVQGLGAITPSLINMNNGAVVRNLMGGSTNDVHTFRYWGTKGAAEVNDKLVLRLGGGGSSPKMQVEADWGHMTDLALSAGHGGGDFWVLYYFARQVLTGERAPFDIYSAADVTIPGILAYRSSIENGRAYDVPNWRNKKEREPYRNDHFAQPRVDPYTVCFPGKADKKETARFDTIMSKLIPYALQCRAYLDWSPRIDAVSDRKAIRRMATDLSEAYPEILLVFREAKDLADTYPRSEGARLLREMLDVADAGKVSARGFLEKVKKASVQSNKKRPGR